MANASRSMYLAVRRPVLATTALTIAATLLLAAPIANAFNFGDMMNPGRWMGGNKDRYYDDDYYGGPWGPGYGGYGAPGYGAPGYGGYGAPGYGAPGYGGYGAPGYGGYGVPGYGGYGAPAYGVPAAPAAPTTGASDAKEQEIEALKRRIDQLESRQAPAMPANPPARGGADGWPAAPAFRPMDQY